MKLACHDVSSRINLLLRYLLDGPFILSTFQPVELRRRTFPQVAIRENKMKFVLLGTAAIAAAALVTPLQAQEVIYKPGYCAQFYPSYEARRGAVTMRIWGTGGASPAPS